MNGKIALVTGSSRGLGKDAVLNLAQQGADIVITYKSNAGAAEEVVKAVESLGQRAVKLPLDTGNISALDSFVDKLSQELNRKWNRKDLDILVNNAGIGAHAMVSDTTEETFDELLNVQFKGVFFLTQKLLPLIKEGGRIINLSTGLTRFSFPGYAAYASMKGAVEVFTRYLAKEIGPKGITVNVIAPGAIDNDFNKHAFNANPQIKEMIAAQTALGRVGVSEDIGGVVAYLASDAARWITGQRIEASGGMFL